MKPYGCWNKTAEDGYYVQDGYLEVKPEGHEQGQPMLAVPKMVWIPNPMSRDCRYDKKKTDERCEGCKQ